MARKRIGVDFKGFEEAFERLDKLGGDIKKTAEKALEKSFDIMTPGIESKIRPHYFTGETQESLVKRPEIEWDGEIGRLPIGFDISDGGLPSIFLMYGTPTIAPDKKLYNSIYGAAILRKVREAQSEVVRGEIEKVMR